MLLKLQEKIPPTRPDQFKDLRESLIWDLVLEGCWQQEPIARMGVNEVLESVRHSPELEGMTKT